MYTSSTEYKHEKLEGKISVYIILLCAKISIDLRVKEYILLIFLMLTFS